MFRSCKKEEKGKKGEFTLLNEDTVEEWESEYDILLTSLYVCATSAV